MMSEEIKTFQLNERQVEAIEKMEIFLQSDEDEFMLKGAGGCGKTFVIETLINNMENPYMKNNILYCSPTHKALNVLKKSLKNISIRKDNFTTIARLLSYTQMILLQLDDNGNEVGVKKFLSNAVEYKKDGTIFREEKNNEIVILDRETHTVVNKVAVSVRKTYFSLLEQIKPFLLIIDECSMIKRDEHEILMQIKKKFNLKIIYLGDYCQLPPVEEDKSNNISKTFSKTKSCNTFGLTKNMRTDCPDIGYCNKLFRNCVFTKGDVRYKLYNLYKKNSEDVIITQDVKVFKNYMKKYFKAQTDSVAIAYSNKKVSHYNSWIQETIFPDRVDVFEEGDIIKFSEMTTVEPMCDGVKDCKNWWEHWPCTRIYNGNQGVIISMGNGEINYKICPFMKPKNKAIKIYKMVIKLVEPDCDIEKKTGNGLYANVNVVCKKDKERYNRYVLKYKKDMIKNQTESKLTKGKKQTEWAEYYKLIQKFNVSIKLVYAMTSHKSQGSSIENVFFDMTDFSYCDDFTKYRAMYTAISRARKKLIIYTDFSRLDKNLLKNNTDTDLFEVCSGCHIRREISKFIRKGGEKKKTCNPCSISRKKTRKNKRKIENLII
jgi:exodeoxyribonuclease-5